MKLILLIFAVLLLSASCNNGAEVRNAPIKQIKQEEKLDLTGYVKHYITLKYGLGTISIYLPEKFDSSFAFVQRSDCGSCCEEYVNRFSSKRYTINNDGRYTQEMKIDSLYQFTISQTNGDCPVKMKIDSGFAKALLSKFFEEELRTKSGKHKSYIYQKDTLNIAVAELGYNHDNKADLIISCVMLLHKNEIFLNFNYFAKDTAGFTGRMLTSLKTIEIDTTK